ncbi:MAG: hypothetical protein ACK4HV_02135 [Parachlamydiaceae bacterium]
MTPIPSKIPIYPELGRQLERKDLNQMIVRVRPYFSQGKLFFDYIPESIEKIAFAAFKLIELDALGMTILKDGMRQSVHQAEAFSSIYLTVDEFKAQIPYSRVVRFNRDLKSKEEIRLIERPVWPSIGRKLTVYDIGKKVVRAYPSLFEDQYEYSSVPYSISGLLNEDRFEGIEGQSLVFTGAYFNFTNINDDHYLPLDEFLSKAHSAKKEVHVLACGQLIEIRK